MALPSEYASDHTTHRWFVVDRQNTQAAYHPGLLVRQGCVRELYGGRRGLKRQAELRPTSGSRLHRDSASVLFDNTEHLREAQSSAALAFCTEKRLKDVRLNLRRHTDARIRHTYHDVLAVPVCGENDVASSWHRIDGVEHQIGERFAQRGGS